jgi:protein-tyrosine phosphatase
MFSFFKKRDLITDISWLGVDIHSHILPGIDDGSKSLAQSLGYIHKLVDLGFDKLYFTPHILEDLYPNTPETILPVLQEVQNSLSQENNITVIGAAAEYMVDDSFKIDDDLLCLPGRHILIEMSYLSESPNIEQVIFELQVKGYKIVLAHPERYNFYHKNIARYHRLREMGCLLQLNLLSLTGYYGKAVQQASGYLLAQNMYDLAATDLHHDKHLALLEKIVRNGELYSKVGNYEFKNKSLFDAK